MSRKFVTIIAHGENLELRKDPGQIPYHFHKTLGYDSTLVTYYYTTLGRKAGPVATPPTNSEMILQDYPFLVTETPGLKMKFLPNLGRGKFYEKAILTYIRTHARSIDILNLFHFSSENIFYGLIYKLLNPRGKLYLKLDLSIDFFKGRESVFNTGGKIGQLKQIVYHNTIQKLFFLFVDIISGESKEALDYFKQRFKVSNRKLLLIPNGIDQERAKELVKEVTPFTRKENIVLTCGRIGYPQKNNELMLKAIPEIAHHNWKFVFIGPVKDDFQIKIEQFYQAYPHLREQVIFTGNIDHYQDLLAYYNRAKIFWMTSKWEGSPIAAVEAAYLGNILVLHEKIHAFNILTNQGQNGLSFNEDTLVNTMNELLPDTALQESMYEKTLAYSAEWLSWSTDVKKIHGALYVKH